MGTARRMTGPAPEAMAASTLMGDAIVDAKGTMLGTLTEIVLEMETCRVTYAVMTAEGEKYYAIPWEALTFDARNKRLRLDMDKEHFASVPAFDRDHWPDMADREWSVTQHQFFGRRPYWDLVEERWISGP